MNLMGSYFTSGLEDIRDIAVWLYVSLSVGARIAIVGAASAMAAFATAKSAQQGIVYNVLLFATVFALTAAAGVGIAWLVAGALTPGSFLRHPMPT